ncbi:MAG: 50S ribosomal protein L21e [Candidatus Methanolliviera hydrocarbonicum]|jgi:LSU ribosomal protein L21E|uniref:Large ribosomal subunit protein eL21 n=1 Tax=Candidatus Methanolliviera hydrocarbonicum TaxID=2491085 RepID=A0A520KY29_9EURY|nr:MAG: 50S ribosomal protein L21e [Candidatus Methanolliviera hydrocarbonicum]
MAKSHGFKRKTRKKLRKSVREKGLSPITRAIQEFDEGDRVYIKIDPSVHKGMPHPRFHGMNGKIIERRGRAYLLEVKDGNKKKTLIARPQHLKR